MPVYSNRELIKDLSRQFSMILNRTDFSEAVFNDLLKKYYLDKFDLEKEVELINKHQSGLSSNQRLAAIELLKIKKTIDEKKNAVVDDISSLG